MRYRFAMLILAICLAPLACKRRNPPAQITKAHTPASQPATAHPATQPIPLPADATFSEAQLVEFIAQSRLILPTYVTAHGAMERSPEGFAALAMSLDPEKPAPVASAAQLQQWQAIGTRAWAAWSVAQVDYNAEAPLRENAAKLTDAKNQLAHAQATLKAGAPILSPGERARRISAASDSATNANDRAQMWHEKADRLRDQLADPTPLPGVSPRSDPAIATARDQRLAAISAARAAMSEELAAAELNERQAQEDARRAGEIASHPELPVDAAEKSDLLEKSRQTVDRKTAEIAHLQRDAELLQIRLSEDRRVDAAARRKAASESDIALLRKHLKEFNDAWGMAVDGRGK
ncbi:MAG TPA: hypothetical protein VFE47_26125 [Tepidisphaeraceae bacterium]|nr:hypothetical protein [Tepidisphaeraceae bacterium]